MLVFKHTSNNAIGYNKSTKGFEFISEVETLDEFQKLVLKKEQNYVFLHDSGEVKLANGEVVFNPQYPDEFNFIDYRYIVIFDKIKTLDADNDKHLIEAISEK